MNVKPMIFNSEMIRALLDGRKSQTRRVCKPQPPENSALHRYYGDVAPRKELRNSLGWFVQENGDLWPCNDSDRVKCPFEVGMLLYVRETWGTGSRPCPQEGSREGLEYKAKINYGVSK